MAMLWPESDASRARHLLRDSIYRLRDELGDAVLPTGGDEVRLDPTQVACDIWDFEGAVAAQNLEAADRAYGGPFLDGFFLADSMPFEHWAEEERHRLAGMHVRVLESLATSSGERGDWLTSVALRRRLVIAEPQNGRLAVRYMEALDAAGDRAAALRHAERHAEFLRSELDAASDPEVEALAARLRRSPKHTEPIGGAASAVSARPAQFISVSSPTRGAPAAVTLPHHAARGFARRGGLLAGVLATIVIGRQFVVPREAATAIRVGSSAIVTAEPGIEVHGAMSPDGKMVAYAAGIPGRTTIFVRSLSGGRAIPIATDSTAQVQMYPRWSRDGSQILYSTAGQGVFVVPVLGGPPRQVVAGTGGVSWAIWSPDGRDIAFTRGDSLYARTLHDGSTRFVGARGRYLHACDWSPHVPLIACVTGNWEHATPTGTFGNIGPSTIVLIPATGGDVIPMTDSLALNTSPAWDPGGRRLFFVSNRHGPRDIYAQRISARGEPIGDPVRVTSGLNAQSVSISADGKRMLYSVYTASANVYSVGIPLAAPASASAATQHTAGTQVVERMNLSSDGRWLYYDSNLRGNSDIYRVSVNGGEPERLTSDAADEYAPIPSPDGREVAFYSLRSGNRDIYVMPLDGGPVQQVTTTPEHEFYPHWSPDGRALAYSTASPTFSTYVTRRRSNGEWEQPVLRAADVVFPQWSPDGRRLLVQKRLSPGMFTLPVDSGAPTIIFADTLPGGRKPSGGRWSPDGRLIYFRHSDRQGRPSLWSLPVTGGRPRQLLRLHDPALSSNRPSWTIDGKRFFFLVDDHRSDLWIADISNTRR